MSATAALLCLAMAGYTEARGEPEAGEAAAMRVVLNRAASGRWPDHPCGVVLQPRQFHGLEAPVNAIEAEAASRSLRIATALLSGARIAPPACQSATHFQRARVWPGMQPVCRIGRHTFYVEDRT